MDNVERYKELCGQIKRPGIDDLMRWLDKTDFYTCPASSRYHGACPGGLLDHSLDVYDELHRLLPVYPEIVVSDETAAIVSLFHDLCKVNFYVVEKRNRKNEYGHWEAYDYYNIKEQFHYGGHGSKSVFIVQSFIKLTPEEAVSINNHMGAFDNERVGDSYEQYPLAWLLHVSDEAACYIKHTKDETKGDE